MIPFAAPSEKYAQWIRAIVTDGMPAPFPSSEGKERARTLIEGDMILSIPIAGGSSRLKKEGGEELMISGHGRWQEVHLGALRASYGKTPYFIHLYPEIEKIYREKSGGTLSAFNEEIHHLVCRWLGVYEGIPAQFSEMNDRERKNIRRIAEERRRIISPSHSILEALFRLGKESIFVLL